MAKSKLTLYIFLALIFGILAGYVYNIKTISSYNEKIFQSELQLKSLQLQMLAVNDTTSQAYQSLKTQKAAQNSIRKENDTIRESKLEYFTMLSDIFLRLIKMIVAPLVFTTLVVGVAKVGDIKAVGRIGGKTMLWFVSATIVSLLLGMVLVNFFEPGKSMHLTLPDEHLQSGIQKTALSLKDFLAHVFPRSFVEAMANNEILQIVIFSLFFGVATAAIGEKGAIIIKAMDAIAHVILKITSYVMYVAPLAVFGAMT
ncbi:MAG: cation:dicarboxylase symporter family transporter, partial [Sphingobacteriaceae bacterium]